MKKNIQKNDMMSKFQSNQLAALSTITGGAVSAEVEKTTTGGYNTSSSATDSDQGDHDSDAGPAPVNP